MLHVVLFAHDAFHRFFVGVERMVEASVVFKRVGGFGDGGFQFDDPAFLLDSAQERVFVKEQNQRSDNYRGEKR